MEPRILYYLFYSGLVVSKLKNKTIGERCFNKESRKYRKRKKEKNRG